ncbi:SET domain-containing protein [Synoicihabitans lomoniglobus]|uniref:SET domain-containing protein-lysine N-methyltransferase n=1 Tax=Synoicihabitans lomoniglobus TaxID=2909285 RepID=A0AAE9ZRR4_9BACT|nr:SET domain-containing protein-lysine N-methyltransferase [Opitutaceae bacterium LMO-M01]WED64035.1 SET domain-containing protein-lysine N-methyltransferase [Opitutaceae bacterium LMO-M01]
MQTLPSQALEAREESSIHGSGVYARQAIADGDFITEYTGEIIDLPEAIKREKARQERKARGEECCDYLYLVDDDMIIDGRDSGNVARLINHSCEANCRSDVLDDRVWIIAAQDIAAGEELTFDYSYTFRDGLGHPCRCGAASCLGYIVAKHQRWRVRRWLKQQPEFARPTQALPQRRRRAKIAGKES